MKRFIDKAYFTHSVYSARSVGINVKCPACSSKGVVSEKDYKVSFKCFGCMLRKEKFLENYYYRLNVKCVKCDRSYKKHIKNKIIPYKYLYVECPYCGRKNQGKVNKIKGYLSFPADIMDCKEPLFGLDIWYKTEYKGQYIWALNKDHLDYLIEYIAADLREKPTNCFGSKTQSDHLPTFIKKAKNRHSILKILNNIKNNY